MSRVEQLEALLKQNLLEEAVTLAADSLRAAPRDPEAHNALGVVLARAGRYPEAERCYRTALRLDPRRGPI